MSDDQIEKMADVICEQHASRIAEYEQFGELDV